MGILRSDGATVAIPVGAVISIHDEAVGHPLILRLQSVSVGKLVFGLLDDSGTVGTEYTYKLHGAKPLNRAALARLKAQGKAK